MSNLLASAARTLTFVVLLAKKATVEAAFASLAKRAARKSLVGGFGWTWGSARTILVDDVNEEVIDLTVTGEEPKLAGWSFAAVIDHAQAEDGSAVNVLRAVPGVLAEGETLPVVYRSRGPVCDHCKASRRRADTFVLRHEDGRYMQVGSTCLVDFLGGHNALEVAAKATFWADVAGAAEDDGMGGYGSSGGSTLFLPTWLATCSAAVRHYGWTSRAASAEGSGRIASADVAFAIAGEGFDDLIKKVRADGVLVTDEDRANGLAVREWMLSLGERSDIESNDYLYNLFAIAKINYVDARRTSGLACSAVNAMVRETTERAARAAREARGPGAHVGTVGGAREMFVLTLVHHTSWENDFGTTYLYIFEDAAGNNVTWKASSHQELAKGETYEVTGSVKSHGEYKGRNQTQLTRCKVAPVGAAAALAAAKPAKKTRAKKTSSEGDSAPTSAA